MMKTAIKNKGNAKRKEPKTGKRRRSSDLIHMMLQLNSTIRQAARSC
jgi:hypothetical protein